MKERKEGGREGGRQGGKEKEKKGRERWREHIVVEHLECAKQKRMSPGTQ